MPTDLTKAPLVEVREKDGFVSASTLPLASIGRFRWAFCALLFFATTINSQTYHTSNSLLRAPVPQVIASAK